MKIYELQRQQWVAASPVEVFEFFSQPENLAQLTPASLGFRILTPLPVVMQKGTVIDYVIHLLKLPVRWRTLITEFEPPRRFVDEQLRGPYDFWHHTHTFSPHEGGTSIEDRVRYTLPLGPLGNLAHVLFVRHQLEQIFAFRATVIGQIFDTGG